MKINFKSITLMAITAATIFSSCQKGDLLSNPNVAAESSTIPASLILNHITANMMREEEPIISQVYKQNQFIVSNYSYYFGSNSYSFGTSNTMYDEIKYCVKLEEQAQKQYNSTTNNPYFALSKFFKAYSLIWYSQRVGDIPATQAVNTNYVTPKYDTQHDVYKYALSLLDSANSLLAAQITATNASTKVDASGDIFGLTYLQWQKVVNTYKLRTLISLSKRATDNADLNIPTQFATIINNPSQYPIMTSTSDNLAYKYNSINYYPPNRAGYVPYNLCENISSTFMNILTTNKDPRTFVLTTPASALVASTTVGDFSAYVGEDNNKSQSLMSNFTADGKHASLSWNRYFSSSTGANAEPYTIIGYAEMCFNIAEAANRGWITTQSAATWYGKGVDASLSTYGITDGKVLTVGNGDGTKPNIGTVTADVATFKTKIAYAGDNATGLTQILTQKYVAFFMNSGFEAYYNWRRTGVPTFSQNGAGIGTADNIIPFRWQYPNDEKTSNTTNVNAAIASQYGGTDDLTAKMWLIK